MTLHVPRLPISLDPLMAEAKRRMRQRRLLVGALIVALAAAAAGASLALRGPGGPSGAPTGAGHGLATANMGQLSMVYPAAWKQVKWDCWIGVGNYLLLTTARPTPTCGSALPPLEQLGRDGVAVWLGSAGPLRRNASGKLVSNPNPTTGLWPGEKRATCASGAGPRRRFGARLQHGSVGVLMGAVVCGPDYGKGEGALERMLASARFRQ